MKYDKAFKVWSCQFLLFIFCFDHLLVKLISFFFTEILMSLITHGLLGIFFPFLCYVLNGTCLSKTMLTKHRKTQNLGLHQCNKGSVKIINFCIKSIFVEVFIVSESGSRTLFQEKMVRDVGSNITRHTIIRSSRN